MNQCNWRNVGWLVVVVFLLAAPRIATAQNSSWVKTGSTGRLIYVPDAEGDRILDFSNVGYQGRGTELVPSSVPAVRMVSPSDGDDTANLQAAINQVAALPLQANGYRGAVLLSAGHYDIATQLDINASGIVLRGAGRGENGTVLHARGTSQRSLVNIVGAGSQSLIGGAYTMVDKVVPAGANSFRLNSTAGLAVGQTVRLERPGTQAWVDAVGMGLPDGGDPAWLPSEFNIRHDRVITRIESDRVFLDAPLATSFEAQFGGSTLQRYTWSGRIQNVGIENIRAESDFNPAEVDGADFIDEDHAKTFVNINRAQNVWVRDSMSKHFWFASVLADDHSKWVTVDNVINEEPVSQVIGERRYTFDLDGQMGLVTNSSAEKGRHDFVNNGAVASVGPNVFHNSIATDARNDTGPHRRWATATLFDNITVEGNNINVQNRGTSGTRHGWAGANMVIWNSHANGYRVQNPPTSQNWLIGSVGTNQNLTPQAYVDSHGTPVSAAGTQSLYEAQLSDSSDIRVFHWNGGAGDWSDALQWNQEVTPGVYSVTLRDYMVGDIDNFTFNGPDSPDETFIDPNWTATIQQQSALPLALLDEAGGDRNVAFTIEHELGAGERVIHGFLALALKQSGDSVSDDFLQLFDTSPANTLNFSSLGWASQINTTTPFVGVVDMGMYLDQSQVQASSVNVRVSDDTAVDWAIYTVAVATPKAEAAGATVYLDGGDVLVDSVVAPVNRLQNGVAGESELKIGAAGRLTVSGDYFQAPGATLRVQLADTADEQFGQLLIGDAAQLAGTLEIELAEEFFPSAGDEFPIISAGGGFGGTMFDITTLPNLTGDLFWSVTYNANDVILRVTSPAALGDFNGDGQVDAADYTVWRDTLHANLPAYSGADGNGDGLVDASDYLVWRSHFGESLSNATVAQAGVPEPMSILLLLVAGAALSSRSCRSK